MRKPETQSHKNDIQYFYLINATDQDVLLKYMRVITDPGFSSDLPHLHTVL